MEQIYSNAHKEYHNDRNIQIALSCCTRLLDKKKNFIKQNYMEFIVLAAHLMTILNNVWFASRVLCQLIDLAASYSADTHVYVLLCTQIF